MKLISRPFKEIYNRSKFSCTRQISKIKTSEDENTQDADLADGHHNPLSKDVNHSNFCKDLNNDNAIEVFVKESCHLIETKNFNDIPIPSKIEKIRSCEQVEPRNFIDAPIKRNLTDKSPKEIYQEVEKRNQSESSDQMNLIENTLIVYPKKSDEIYNCSVKRECVDTMESTIETMKMIDEKRIFDNYQEIMKLRMKIREKKKKIEFNVEIHQMKNDLIKFLKHELNHQSKANKFYKLFYEPHLENDSKLNQDILKSKTLLNSLLKNNLFKLRKCISYKEIGLRNTYNEINQKKKLWATKSRKFKSEATNIEIHYSEISRLKDRIVSKKKVIHDLKTTLRHLENGTSRHGGLEIASRKYHNHDLGAALSCDAKSSLHDSILNSATDKELRRFLVSHPDHLKLLDSMENYNDSIRTLKLI